MKKKLTALLLSLVMLLGAAPAFAAEDGDTSDLLISPAAAALPAPPFTASAGETELTDISARAEAYVPWVYDAAVDGMVPTAPVTVYTVTVPEGTEKVTIRFEEARLAYNYMPGNIYLTGALSDEYAYTGAEIAEPAVDFNADGVADYIQVQSPYDEAWNSTTLYAITFTGPGLKAPVPFADLKADWYREGVEYVWENGLMRGAAASSFAPNLDLTRAEVATVIGRMAGRKLDGTGSEWYAGAMLWAEENGILVDADGRLEPLDVISREETVVLLYRYLQTKGEGFRDLWAYELPASDRADVSADALEAVSYFYMKGYLVGKDDGRFDPAGSLTRAEFATILCRMGTKE